MTAATKTQRDLYETAVIERLKESGFLEIEIRTESLMRCGDGYQDEVINAGWHYWNAALSAAEPVGQVDASYGEAGMLVASFKPSSLPVGTKLYTAPAVAVKALADACRMMVDDYQTSDNHHPNHALVPLTAFDAMRSALSAQVQDVTGTVEEFDKDHPELYWHIAKGKITAGEPLYGAIVTDLQGNELGHGESDASAVDALNVAGAKASLPSAPKKQDIAALETQLKHLITTRPNKAALAAFDDDTRMWFVAQLTGTASGRIPLTEIEALVARHLPPANNDPHLN